MAGLDVKAVLKVGSFVCCKLVVWVGKQTKKHFEPDQLKLIKKTL